MKHLLSLAVTTLAATLLFASATSAQTTEASAAEAAPTAAAPAEERGFLGLRFDVKVVAGEPIRALDVTALMPQGPAATAGLEVGDRIVQRGGVDFAFEDEQAAHGAFDDTRIGEEIALTVVRGDETVALTIRAGAPPQTTAQQGQAASQQAAVQASMRRLATAIQGGTPLELRRTDAGVLEASVGGNMLDLRAIDLLRPSEEIRQAMDQLPAGEVLTIAMRPGPENRSVDLEIVEPPE
ncbi:MAG: PDZ domain-containing protein [Acidobacteriota bacterium]